MFEVNEIPRHAKHIKPKSGIQQSRIGDITAVKIEVVNDSFRSVEKVKEKTAITKGAYHL